MKARRTARRRQHPKRGAKASAVRKPQPKAAPVYYARETLVAARLIRQEVGISLSNAPDLE